MAKKSSVIGRIEAFFRANVGKIVSNAEIRKAAIDPDTGLEPENWHQRLSELRVNSGYTIESNRDNKELSPGQYRLASLKKNKRVVGRVVPSKTTWTAVLTRAANQCEWVEGKLRCQLKEGDIDPVSGGTVHLTADHSTPHSIAPNTDVNNTAAWLALCSRHQIVKKNYWDNTTGKLNVEAIVQNASKKLKQKILTYLQKFFGEKSG